MKTLKILVTLFSVVLSACGGGGGSPSTTPPVTSTLAFPAQSGYRAMVANGGTTNYTITGTCSGTESDVRSTPVSGTFEGVAALGVIATTTVNYTQCTAASGTATSTIYYNTNYANVGMSSSSQYAVLITPPVLPTSVKVGDTGTYGTANIYANSSKATLQGRFVLSYAVEADTANTAIIVFITKRYDANSVLQWTEQDRKRIASSGALTPVSIDRQSNISADHIILTVTSGGSAGGTTTPSYVTQGGLTWMPETFQDTWMNASAYCANTTINGQTGWRMPTQAELSALYTSGLMKGHGWALSYDWSSTSNGAGNHYTVGLYDGSIHTTSDTSTFYVSCVRTFTGGNGGGTGTGIAFSSSLGGINFIPNTSLQNGVYVTGARKTGSTTVSETFTWDDVNISPPFLTRLSYVKNNTYSDYIAFNFGGSLYGVICSITTPIAGTYAPLCSSLGVSIDRSAGVISFSATPTFFNGTQTNTTATGSMSFPPF